MITWVVISVCNYYCKRPDRTLTSQLLGRRWLQSPLVEIVHEFIFYWLVDTIISCEVIHRLKYSLDIQQTQIWARQWPWESIICLRTPLPRPPIQSIFIQLADTSNAISVCRSVKRWNERLFDGSGTWPLRGLGCCRPCHSLGVSTLQRLTKTLVSPLILLRF